MYSFGMVLFELLCGVKAFEIRSGKNDRPLYHLVRSYYEEGRLDEFVVPGLIKQMDPESLKIFSETAYYCIKERRAERPNIDQIVIRLQKALEFQMKSENLKNIFLSKTYYEKNLESEDWDDVLKIKKEEIVRTIIVIMLGPLL